MQRLTALDASFLPLSTGTAPLTIGSVVLLEAPAPEADAIRALLRERLGGRPELRRRVVRAPLDVVRPLWRDDPFDDAGEHLVVRPADRTLEDEVAAILESGVALDRPPWAVHLLTGLGDGRWALVLTAHHALADGRVGAGLLRTLLDGAEQPAVAPRARPRPHRPLRVALRTVVRAEQPPSVLSGPLGRRRVWRCATIPTAEVLDVARRQGCTVNDVFLAVLAGAYRDYLGQHDERHARVRVLVPVSARGLSDPARSGNLDSALFVNLPVDEPDPGERLRSVARQTRAAKAAGIPGATEVLLGTMGRAPYAVLARAARRYAGGRQRRVNSAAPCVRGPDGALSLLGRTVLMVAPMVPLALEVRTTVALLTCGGAASLGFTADADNVPDLDALVAAALAAWDDMAAL